MTMMKNLWRSLAASAALVLMAGSPLQATAGDLAQFYTQQDAQQHCPRDTVVWLNLPTGIYHFQGQRWYGATTSGAYVCRREADAEGDRATRNGQ